MPFDIQAAKQEGYSDSEIAGYLAESRGFDIEGARKEGYGDAEILSHLTGGGAPSPAPGTGGVNLGEYQGAPVSPDESMALSRQFLEGGGLLGGAALGSLSGPVTAVAGGGLGYGIGRNIANRLEEAGGMRPPETLGESFQSAGEDVATGATMEMGGQAGGKLLTGAARAFGKAGRQVIGKLTGAGEGAAAEAVRGSEAFTKAMRGELSGEEIVSQAKDALGAMKAARAEAYRGKLVGLQGGKPLDTRSITTKLSILMQRYGVRVGKNGALDLSRTAVGKRGIQDLRGVIRTVQSWGKKPGDTTPAGLDTLKRQLDDFYSESSQARGFVAELRNEVRDTITRSVPEYAEMTKGYAEATRLIKDIESGLMLRKQGMSGRIVADATLRRLTSAMRENFPLRRELLQVLGNKGGEDLAGEVGGFAMSPLVPRGLAGTGPALAGYGGLAYLSPKFWPVIAASSPRVSGEFLRLFGKYLAATPGASQVVGRAAAYGIGKATESDRRRAVDLLAR